MSDRTTQTIEVEEWQVLSKFAARLADLAADKTLSHFRQNPDIENKADGSGTFDPVTEADKQAEIAMVDLISSTYPDHGIFAEETGIQKPDASYRWVIDPIDGTGSFVCGIPLWGTLIGLLKDNKPVLGLMDQPFLQERFIGSVSGSVLMSKTEEQVLKTSSCKSLSEAKLATTSPDLFTEEEKSRFEEVKSAAKLTRFGTDCSAYGLLAAGHLDLVIEAGLNSYDILALIPIIEGAGGVVSTWNNTSATQGGQIIASATPELHSETLKILGT